METKWNPLQPSLSLRSSVDLLTGLKKELKGNYTQMKLLVHHPSEPYGDSQLWIFITYPWMTNKSAEAGSPKATVVLEETTFPKNNSHGQ